MVRKPIIGISPSQNDGFIKMRANYAESIIDAGGIPVFLPYTTEKSRIADYTRDLDGLLFAGGVDVDPKYYGETVMFDSVEINEARDSFELALFTSFYASGKPIFGICRGIQLINVALGGSLFQHLDGHHQSKTDGSEAFIRNASLTHGTRLCGICGGEAVIHTNSFHHQAVKQPAPGVVVSAVADDGIIEAIEKPDYGFLLAVQWHPEMFYRRNSHAAALFRAFVSAAGKDI